MAGESEERAVRTELLHREVNERIRHVATDIFDLGDREQLWIVCECLRLSCSERVELRAEAYRRVRESPARFIVVPGHEEPGLERVVEEQPGYRVVEKEPAIVERLSEGRAAAEQSFAAGAETEPSRGGGRGH